MNNPNYENIDRWLFDYVEGNLSSNQESMLENFILNHPELEVDLDMWRMSNIKTSNAFVNDRPFVTSNIIGATTMDQLKQNIDSIDLKLSEEILKEIEDVHLSNPNPCV